MDGRFTEEKYLLRLLSESLKNKDDRTPELPEGFRPDWKRLLTMAEHHAVLPLLYDILQESELSEEDRKRVENISRRTVQQNYHLLFFSRYIIQLLQRENIDVVLLKGAAAGYYYPVPELRKSGDVDLLIFDRNRLEDARRIFQKEGFYVEKKQLASHHLAIGTPEGIEIELHTMLAEPFDNHDINNYLIQTVAEMKNHIRVENLMGVELPVLSDGCNAYYLLVHMLQHFLREGFGLKLLCDWVVFWNRETDPNELQIYKMLVKESGLEGFSGMITSLCVHFLGLKNTVSDDILPEEISMEYMKDIFEAEEFGKSNRDRMLVLKGTKISDYVWEFHRQMHINYPAAGKIWVFWPVLWMATLVRFLYNNRKVRRTSSIKILKQAGKRSWMLNQLNLFQK